VPAPTFRTTPSASGDVAGPITLAVLALLAVLLVVGLLVVARGLTRGQPLLAPLAPAPEEEPPVAPPDASRLDDDPQT
jgi:hypothetical protein